MRILTTKWLIEKRGCVSGVKWFKKNYPDGMVFTKENINELVGKLLKKKKIWWAAEENNRYDVCNNLDWLADRIGWDSRHPFLSGEDWSKATQKQITDKFWEDYKEITK